MELAFAISAQSLLIRDEEKLDIGQRIAPDDPDDSQDAGGTPFLALAVLGLRRPAEGGEERLDRKPGKCPKATPAERGLPVAVERVGCGGRCAIFKKLI